MYRPKVLFQSIADITILHARRITTQALCIVLRCIYIQHNKSPSHLIHSQIGLFQIHTKQLGELLMKCFKDIQTSDSGLLSEPQVIGFIHKFLILSFTKELHETNPIGSIFEQVILLCCASVQQGDLVWKSATSTAGLCSITFWTARSMMIHAAFNGGLDHPMKAPELLSNSLLPCASSNLGLNPELEKDDSDSEDLMNYNDGDLMDLQNQVQSSIVPGNERLYR
jgi:hypothetical protein